MTPEFKLRNINSPNVVALQSCVWKFYSERKLNSINHGLKARTEGVLLVIGYIGKHETQTRENYGRLSDRYAGGGVTTVEREEEGGGNCRYQIL